MIYVGYSKVLCDSWCDVCSKRMVVDQNLYLRRVDLRDDDGLIGYVDLWFCSNPCLREDIEMS